MRELMVLEREIDPSCFALATGLIASDSITIVFFVPPVVFVFLTYSPYELFMPLRS